MPHSASRRLLPVLALVGAALAATGERAGAGRPLQQRVTIVRDTYGVPHITGDSDEAVAFGLGYAQAEDHAALVGRRILEARGEAARVFGPDALANDLAAQRLDHLNAAGQQLRRVGRPFLAALRAFAAGVNHYVAQHQAEVPAWMPRLTEVDLLAASRSDAQSAFAPSVEQALRRKYPPGTPPPPAGARLPAALAPDPAGLEGDAGSNALALSGRRTWSGHAMLLGNPHLRWSARYWEAHLIVPGRLNFYGSTLVGIPWLRAGFNDRLGYVQTNNAPDYQDVYALQAEAGRPDAYFFDGKWRRLTRRDVAVQVRQADGSLTTEQRTYWSSHLGPVVYRTPDRVFALKSAGLASWQHFEGFFELSHSRSLAEYERVMRRALFYTSNFTYADADGHILYRWMTRLPRRPDPTLDCSLDVPGEKRLVWQTLHTVDDLPRLLDPPGGSVQNANNSPWYTTSTRDLDPARYPPYVERGDLALRPQLALQLLDATPRFSPDDVIRLKYDTRMLLADRVKPALLSAIAALPAPSPDLQRARDILAAWDNRVDAPSNGAVLFSRFWETYRPAVAQPFEQPWSAQRPFDTPSGLGNPAAALEHLERAARWVREQYGSEAVAWGDVHRFRFGDLDLPGDGAAGQLGLYRRVEFDAADNGKRVAGQDATGKMLGSGDAWVLLVHFARPVQAWSVLAYGQSGDPGSTHTRDQIRVFANRQLRPVYFTPEEIATHTERKYTP